MWSHIYWYYEIKGPDLPTAQVLAVMERTGVLKKKQRQTCCNKDGFPWMDIVVVDAYNGSYGRTEQLNSKTVNLIAIVGSKSAPENAPFYAELFSRIAEELNWELILECDDDLNEDVVLRAIQ